MAGTRLYWINGPWRGRLALAARPHGGDWLGDEMLVWHQSCVNTVVSLLEPSEERSLQLDKESQEANDQGMTFVSFPIPDREVPKSEASVGKLIESLDAQLARGNNAVVHCRQGVGRSGLIAACLLISKSRSSGAALAELSQARGLAVPETREQREWIERFATTLANFK